MNAQELLQLPTPPAADIPARVEALNLCAFDLAAEIATLRDEAAQHEEQAAADASTESNETKRRARKCELLRANDYYQQTRQHSTDLERVHFQLMERAARLHREFRLYVAEAMKEAAL
jgi:phage terminase Nu1 subunit (DNA packaging protein)